MENQPKDEIITDHADEDNGKPPEVLDMPTIPTNDKPQQKKSKKPLIVVVIVLLIVGIGSAYWFLLRDKKSSQPNNSSSQSEQATENIETSQFTTPNNVIYSFRENDSSPFIIYSRPVEGGERKELAKLARDEYAYTSDVHDTTIAYNTDGGIFVSTDGGNSFSNIYELKKTSSVTGEQISSLKINQEGTKIVAGIVEEAGGKNKVTSMDLNGDNQSLLFESEKSGVFIDAWSEKSNKIAYSEGCINCDGNLVSPVIRDLSTNKTTKLSEKAQPGTMTTVEGNADLSQIVIVYGKVDTSPVDGIGINIVAPYTISKVDTTTGKEAAVATIGAIGEKNPNGTVRSRTVLAGYLYKTNDVFYTNDKELYITSGETKSLVLTAENKIIEAPFISKESVIYSYGDPSTGDYNLMNYTIGTKAIVQILTGDNNTQIFGVTTK